MIAADGPWTDDTLRGAFTTSGPLLVDIGVGDGRATVALADERPDARVLAIELHRPGLARLLSELDERGPTNVRISEADAVRVIANLPPGSAQLVRVLFPDPWPKRRHVARRLVDRAFVASAADALAPGGELQLATDWSDYADHMRSMVATDARFEPVTTRGRPPRPVTAYEARGIAAGRTITDLVHRRR